MRVDIDGLGVRALHFEPGLGRAMYEHAIEALHHASAIAPVQSGEYRRRMFATRRPGPSAVAYFGTHSYKGWWVEHGTVNMGANHTLSIAARMAHMKVRHRAKPGGSRVL